MKQFSCIVVVAVTILSACAFSSLHSPRPVQPGDVSLGVGGGALVLDGEVGATFHGNLRVGIAEKAELSASAGSLGFDVAFKYGLTSWETPFQLSLIGSAGLYLYLFMDVSVGLLTGYNFDDIVMPYGGYRQHVVAGLGGFPVGVAIAGVEILPGSVVSFLLEMDYSFSWDPYEDLDEESDWFDWEDVLGVTTVNAAISFNF